MQFRMDYWFIYDIMRFIRSVSWFWLIHDGHTYPNVCSMPVLFHSRFCITIQMWLRFLSAIIRNLTISSSYIIHILRLLINVLIFINDLVLIIIAFGCYKSSWKSVVCRMYTVFIYSNLFLTLSYRRSNEFVYDIARVIVLTCGIQN